MTIPGLPAHVEAVLITALLADHHVKSWTVAGEGQDTVFVLRLNSSQQDPGAAIITSTGQWRKKISAAQVRRDRQRAEDRHRDRDRWAFVMIYLILRAMHR